MLETAMRILMRIKAVMKRGSLKVDKQDMKKINVFDARTLTDIKYASDGTIYSDDEDVNEDLNLKD